MSHSKDSSNILRSWQHRIFATVWITYFSYYLCRYNMSMAKSSMCTAYGWSAEDFGTVFTALTLMYALGQFVNGQLADRFGTRVIASIGVLGSVIMNIAVFIVTIAAVPETAESGTVLYLIVAFWGLNGFFQAMGWSPMVRVMAHWFPTRTRGKTMGLLGTCYQFGGAFSWLLAFFIIGYYAQKMSGDWRAVFLIPSLLFAIVGVIFFLFIRNSPEDVGLEPLEIEDSENKQSVTAVSGQNISIAANVISTLKNPYLWIIALTFFLLDMNRYGFVNWLPAYLDDAGGGDSGSFIATFNFKEVMKRVIHPLAGSAGALIAGWATDRFFGGRRAPVIAGMLFILGLSSILFPYIDPGNSLVVILVVALIGFCTYGPHILMVGHAAQDFGKKSGVAGAAGFIDGMGYIGASLAGRYAGKLIDSHGYQVTFVIFGMAAIIGAVFVSIIWKVGPDTKKYS